MSLSSNLRGSANFVWSTNEPLGQGATGAVYKCRHKVNNFNIDFFWGVCTCI